MDQLRCSGCGKVIESGDKTYRIAQGRSHAEDFHETTEWGRMHERCFEAAVDSPKLILAEVRKLTRTRTTVMKKAPKGKKIIAKAG